MRILLACEESQTVCKAFRALGHKAWSCDIQPSSGGHPDWHFQGDALNILQGGGAFVTESGEPVTIDAWDMLIAFPPCTYLSYAGRRHWDAPGREKLRADALEFFLQFANATHIPRRVIENPIGHPQAVYRPADQIIHPYYFGDNYQKRTCLWLHNVPKLLHVAQDTLFDTKTHVPKPEPYAIAPSGRKSYFVESAKGSGAARQKARSKTFPGIANAMADQWGDLPILTNY